jgi:hypothetical protein
MNKLSLAATLCGLLVAGSIFAQEKVVIVAEGEPLPAVKVGDVVRITGSGAVGRTEVSATVEGPAKLVSTTVVRRFKDGKPLIGATIKEFEIKAEAKGKAVIKVTVADSIDKKSTTKEYTLQIE